MKLKLFLEIALSRVHKYGYDCSEFVEFVSKNGIVLQAKYPLGPFCSIHLINIGINSNGVVLVNNPFLGEEDLYSFFGPFSGLLLHIILGIKAFPYFFLVKRQFRNRAAKDLFFQLKKIKNETKD